MFSNIILKTMLYMSFVELISSWLSSYRVLSLTSVLIGGDSTAFARLEYCVATIYRFHFQITSTHTYFIIRFYK